MTRQEAKERIDKLRKEINYHRYLYHVLDRQEISDEAHDSLKRELARLEEQFSELVTSDSPTQRVGGKPLSGFKKVRHRSSMLSLNDAFSEEEMGEWEKRIAKFLPASPFDYFAEIKVDGFAISLIYENGILKTGSTRGDGKVGEDVTENLKTIESIPLKLADTGVFFKEREIQHILNDFPRVKKAVTHIPKSFEVRGEVYMTKKTFEEINREQEKRGLPRFANPRNIAAGSVRQLDPKITVSRRLNFLAYDIVTDLGQETHEEEHLIARIFGFRTVDLAEYCKDIAAVIRFWKHVLTKREKLPFLIDGIVVQINSGNLFMRLGVVGKAPRGAIALKFPAKETTTLIEDIIVQVGRTGVLTPVAILRSVEIGGVTVSRATLHNLDEIERLGVRVGDTVIIRRAGDVIPDVVKVLKNLRSRQSRPFSMPKTFCGQAVVRRAGEVAHRILHPEKCDLVTREKFYHFVSKYAFDIRGLGPKIIDRLFDEGLVQDPADLFLLKEGDLETLERFAEKSAVSLIQAIQSKKEIELSRFIYALGILHVGEETAADLADHFGTLEALEKASFEDLRAVSNIGEVVAQSIFGWFNEPGHKRFIEKLLRIGVHIKERRNASKSGKFKGLSFVITGGLEHLSRDETKARIRQLGGQVSETVSSKTDYVVVGQEPGSKLEKAKKLGIKIIDEKEFLKFISV